MHFGGKAGAVGPKAALSWAPPAAGSFYGALPSMRRELHSLPMWQECRGNNQTNNRDKRARATSTFPSIFLPPPPHSPPQAALLARGLPHPLHGAGIRESGNQICYWRERERRSSLKENSGVHNPSLHLAQLRWRWGRSKQPAYIPPLLQLQEGRRREGWR